MRISPTGRRGFTLVELLIAITIGGFILAGVAAGFAVVLRARNLTRAHGDDLQLVRQTYLDTQSDFANAFRLPGAGAGEGEVYWRPAACRFPTRDRDGRVGLVEFRYAAGVLWRTWTPLDLSARSVRAGRVLLEVHLDNVEGVVRRSDADRYAIADGLEDCTFAYAFPSPKADRPRGAAWPARPGPAARDGSAADTNGVDANTTHAASTDEAAEAWPQSVTLRLLVAGRAGSTPLASAWTLPITRGDPWRLKPDAD